MAKYDKLVAYLSITKYLKKKEKHFKLFQKLYCIILYIYIISLARYWN